MKRIPDPTETFPYQLWFEKGEIDKIMEIHLATFLSGKEPGSIPPIPIENFLEGYVSRIIKKDVDFDNYADVEGEEGPGTLGVTHFYPDHVIVKIDRKLTEKADRSIDFAGRYNITVAHEASHCLLHSELIRDKPYKMSLYDPLVRFKRDPSKRNYFDQQSTHWLEVQANIGMGALLMPKDLFLRYFLNEQKAYGIANNWELTDNPYTLNLVVGFLSRTFQVSKQAVKVRLDYLCQIPPSQPAQPSKRNIKEQKSEFESVGQIIKRLFN